MEQKSLENAPSNQTVTDLPSGDWKSCYQTAEHLYAQGAYREAFSWYKKASAFSDCNPIVYFELGYLFQHGEGVNSDNIEALKWYEKAASLGVPQAMYNLAYFYQNGLVVDQDLQKAARLLRDATLLMDRLQLERDSYDMWKAEKEALISKAEQSAAEERVRSENLKLRNHELDISLSATKQECQRLEQEIVQHKRSLQDSEKQREILVARTESAENALQKEENARKEVELIQAQLEERLHAADDLISHLVMVHNESFEHVQSSYTAQIDRLQRAYETDFTELQKSKELLHKENVELSRMLVEKHAELSALQESLQQLQTQFEKERKKKARGYMLASIFGVLGVLILFLVI